MSRVSVTGKIVSSLSDVNSILDIGCRDGILRKYIPERIEYYGSDLFNHGNHVAYVGDIMELSFDRKFDIVAAIDILEHLEKPALAFDKLVGLACKHLIVSFPNCYDLKKKYAFLLHGTMGGKYRFSDEDILDRHRWIMGLQEIEEFFKSKATKHGLELTVHDVRYGSSGRMELQTICGRLLAMCLRRSLVTETLIGVFRFPW